MPEIGEPSLSRSDGKHAKFQQNVDAAINRLPAEILLTIISFSEYPSVVMPYPYISFSWVCSYWRSIVLGNAVFWKAIVLDKSMTQDFLRELLRRSQSVPVDIMVEARDAPLSIQSFLDVLAPEASRVRTLHMRSHRSPHIPCLELISFFPSLENIICNIPASPPNLSFAVLPNRPHLKALEISIGDLKDLEMSDHCRELYWLSLTCSSLIPPNSLFKALRNLPNLQVLQIFDPSPLTHPDYNNTISDFANSHVTFHGLKVLIMSYPMPQLINAPNLRYLQINNYPSRSDYSLFCGFDLSGITHIRFVVEKSHVFYITGHEGSEPHFLFHIASGLSIFDTIPTSHPNRFFISFKYPTASRSFFMGEAHGFISLFTALFTKTISLTDLVLKCFGSSRRTTWSADNVKSFLKVLRRATTVRTLTIFWAFSFTTLCNFLSDASLFPRLERLTYVSRGEESHDTCDLLTLLQTLMLERSPNHLELDLTGLPVFRPEQLEQVNNLGVRLTQR